MCSMALVCDALSAMHRVMQVDAFDAAQARDLKHACESMLHHISASSSTPQPSLKAQRVLDASPRRPLGGWICPRSCC